MKTTGCGVGNFPLASLLGALLLGLLPFSARAGMLLFHEQGEPGSRALFFTQFHSIVDRTPMDAILGPVSIYEIEVIAVYEDVSRPDWAAMKLQFECPAAPAPQWPGRRRKSSGRDAAALPAPQRWRMAERGYQFTRDAEQAGLPPTQWQVVSDPAYRKAGMFACNSILVQNALNAAGGARAVDGPVLNAALAPLGVGEIVPVNAVGNVVGLSGYAWSQVWKSQRPAGKGDRVLSAGEIARNRQELDRLGREMEQLEAQAQAYAQPILEAAQDEQAFHEIARKVQGGRQMNELESSMLMVWLGKPEAQVVTRFPARPQVTEAGGLRFISYSDQADTRSAVVSMASGRVVSQSGAYMSCDITVVTAPDRKQAWRVADIRVNANGPAGGMCRSMLNTPED